MALRLVKKKAARSGVILALLVVLGYIYKTFDPYITSYFPKCPFNSITGLECPGCGSQRAIHYLLNFEFVAAFKENALLVLAIPYLLIGIIFDSIAKPSEKLQIARKIIFGKAAIWTIIVIIVSFWVLRNIF